MKIKSPEFRALQSKWYRRLKSEGFTDAEDAKGNLKKFHAKRFAQVKDFEAKQRYYELAEHLLQTFPFTSKESRLIWRRHAAGATSMEIAMELNISFEAVEASIEYVASHIKDV
jgi:hypothetical protein